jgi:hypothetical protein
MNSKWTSTVSHQRLCIVVRSREIILEKQIAQWIWTYFVFFSCRCLVYTNNCFTMCKLILLSYAVRITTVISLIYHLQMNMKASRHFHQQHIIIGIILFCVSSFSRLCRQLDLLSSIFSFFFPSSFCFFSQCVRMRCFTIRTVSCRTRICVNRTKDREYDVFRRLCRQHIGHNNCNRNAYDIVVLGYSYSSTVDLQFVIGNINSLLIVPIDLDMNNSCANGKRNLLTCLPSNSLICSFYENEHDIDIWPNDNYWITCW